MRASSLFVAVLAAVLLAACGPQDRSPEFYAKAENAAEFARALEVCKKSGLSQKDRCVAVWQAKGQMDVAEDRALLERAIRQMEGATIVPQSPGQVTVSEPVSPRRPPNAATAAADAGNQPMQN
ncbi:MAG: hypothetical protein RIQ68_1815 [Pseudomonadota bacterium]